MERMAYMDSDIFNPGYWLLLTPFIFKIILVSSESIAHKFQNVTAIHSFIQQDFLSI